MPRGSLSVAGILLAAAVGGVRGQTVVYSTSFEGPTFVPGNLAAPLGPGQGNWRIEYDDPNRIKVVSGSARTGSQSVRITSDAVDPSGGWAWYDPIQINPIAGGTPLVTVDFSMLLGAGTVSGGWGLEVFSNTLNTMGRIQVAADNSVQVDNAGTFVSTGATVSRGGWNSYRMVFDFITNRYDAFLNSNQIANDYVFNPDTGVIGDLDFRHYQPDPANDFALFDDYSVSIGGQLPSGAEWAINASGNWSVPGNWSTNFVPNGANITAKLGTAISAPRQVVVDAQVSLDQLQIGSPNGYTLVGDPAPGSYGMRFAGVLPLALQVSAGSHEIRTSVKFDKDATIGVFSGAALRFTENVDLTSRNITKAGDGTLRLPLVRANSLTVEAGLVQLTGTGTLAGPAKVSILSANGGTLDLNGHKLVVDYTAGSPATVIRSLLASGRLKDSTLTDPRLAIGYATNTVVGLTQLEDLAVDDTALIARITLKGDADLSGTVDISDFVEFAGNFNRLGIWETGDFTYNGTVDISDFALLATHFNTSAPTFMEGDAVLPEPALGAGIGAILILARRTGRRR